ncbi:hypothetical protein FQZ97_907610 [compost metagenome]
MQLHAGLVVVGVAAVAGHTHVAGGHAADGAVFVVQDFHCGEAGEDIHAQRLGLLAHPLHDVAQADDVVALVVETGRQQPVGRAARAGFGQEQELVLRDGHVQRRAFFLPVGDEFGQRQRVHDGAGQDVRTQFRALFKHADADFLILLSGQLLKTDCGGQAGGSTADHDHVIFHRLAFRHLQSSPYVFQIWLEVLSTIVLQAAPRPPSYFIQPSGAIGEPGQPVCTDSCGRRYPRNGIAFALGRFGRFEPSQ